MRRPADARLRLVSHPVPRPASGRPHRRPAAGRRGGSTPRATALAARALEIAIDRDPTLRDRYDEIGLRRLLRDTAPSSTGSSTRWRPDDPEPARDFAEAVAARCTAGGRSRWTT